MEQLLFFVWKGQNRSNMDTASGIYEIKVGNTYSYVRFVGARLRGGVENTSALLLSVSPVTLALSILLSSVACLRHRPFSHPFFAPLQRCLRREALVQPFVCALVEGQLGMHS